MHPRVIYSASFALKLRRTLPTIAVPVSFTKRLQALKRLKSACLLAEDFNGSSAFKNKALAYSHHDFKDPENEVLK